MLPEALKKPLENDEQATMSHGPLYDALHGAASRYEDAYGATGAHVRPGLAPRIRRRRFAAVSVVTVASLVLLGVASAVGAEVVSHHGTPPADVPLRYARTTISFDESADATGYLPPIIAADAVATCGEAPPDPVPTAGDFALSGTLTGPLGEHVSGDPMEFAGSITYTGTSDLPVDVTDFVWTQGGRVVGFTEDTGSPTFTNQRHGRRTVVNPNYLGQEEICVDGAFVAGDLPPGDYEEYPVIRVLATPELAAKQWLAQQGIDNWLAPPPGQVWAPGSWDCANSLNDGGARNLLCNPHAVPGVTVDSDKLTASVPYDSTVFVREVNVTLIGPSAAITVALPAPTELVTSDGSPSVGSSQYPGGWGPSDLTCGVTVNGPPFAEDPNRYSVAGGMALAPEGSGDTADLSLSLFPVGGLLNGTVTYPDPLTVWFLANTTTHPDGWNSTSYGMTVIGTGTILINGGDPVTLSRFDGPTVVPVEVTDATWCGGILADVTVVAYTGIRVVGGSDLIQTTTALGTWPFNQGGLAYAVTDGNS